MSVMTKYYLGSLRIRKTEVRAHRTTRRICRCSLRIAFRSKSAGIRPASWTLLLTCPARLPSDAHALHTIVVFSSCILCICFLILPNTPRSLSYCFASGSCEGTGPACSFRRVEWCTAVNRWPTVYKMFKMLNDSPSVNYIFVYKNLIR